MNERTLVPIAAVHSPLFLAGKNFGLTLDTKKVQGLTLILEKTEGADRLYVLYMGKAAVIGTSFAYVQLAEAQTRELEKWVASQTEPTPPVATVQTAKTGKHQKVLSAQVSTPQSHVFEPGPEAA